MRKLLERTVRPSGMVAYRLKFIQENGGERFSSWYASREQLILNYLKFINYQ